MKLTPLQACVLLEWSRKASSPIFSRRNGLPTRISANISKNSAAILSLFWKKNQNGWPKRAKKIKIKRKNSRLKTTRLSFKRQTARETFSRNFQLLKEDSKISWNIFLAQLTTGNFSHSFPLLFFDSSNAFHEKVSTISHDRKMNNLTKSRYTELLELLEVPQLVDTTVRNGYYEEALELIEFIRKLERVTSCFLLFQMITNITRNFLILKSSLTSFALSRHRLIFCLIIFFHNSR